MERIISIKSLRRTKMKDIITVAVVNFKVRACDKEDNLSRMCGYVEEGAKRGADLVLLPEMCLYGYDYYLDPDVSRAEKIKTAETIDGPSSRAIAEITKKYGIYAVFGMAQKMSDDDDAAMYNSAVVSGPDGIIGAYQKIHPYGSELSWFEKGSTPFMFDTPWGPVGISVCYDIYQFPEIQRYYCSKGCRLHLNATAYSEEMQYSGSREAFEDYLGTTLEYGVMCNSIYIASSNLTGVDITSYLGGGSSIIGPGADPFFDTHPVYYAGDKHCSQPGMHIATIDLSLAELSLFKDNEYSGEPDYRPDLYKKFD